MSQLIGRSDIEAAATARLSRTIERYRQEIARLLGADPLAKTIPEARTDAAWGRMWVEMERDVADDVGVLLVLAWMASAEQHGLEIIPHDPRAVVFATGRAADVARQFVANTQQRLGSTIDGWINAEPSKAQVAADLESILGPVRAEAVAVTETTVANSAAILATVAMMTTGTGTGGKSIWQLGEAEHCPLCVALHGTDETIWRIFAPNGPPAHVRCACWLNIVPVDATTPRPNMDALRQAAASIGL